MTVSSLINGQYGAEDVSVSLPSVVDQGGVSRVLELPLNEKESGEFKKSAEDLRANLSKAGL